MKPTHRAAERGQHSVLLTDVEFSMAFKDMQQQPVPPGMIIILLRLPMVMGVESCSSSSSGAEFLFEVPIWDANFMPFRSVK